MIKHLPTPVLILLIVLFLLCCGCLLVFCLGGYSLFGLGAPVTPPASPAPLLEALPVTKTPLPAVQTPAPPVQVRTEPPDTLAVLQQTTVPPYDYLELVCRLGGKCSVPKTMNALLIPPRLGDQQAFWVSNQDANEYSQIIAELACVTPHAYFWVEQGVRYNPGKLEKLAREFDEHIYPTTGAFFGSEWLPGVDEDARVYILYARNLGSGIAGYFSSTDQYHPLAEEHSNAHEMFYLSVEAADFGREDASTLAHEYQHMIRFHQDPGETSWVDEGFSMLAQSINGYPTYFESDYAANPDTNFLFWDPDVNRNTPRYGASFMFMDYFLNRFGRQAAVTLSAQQEDGLQAVDAALAEIGALNPETGEALTTEALFLDWAIANYLQDGGLESGRYAYASVPDMPQAKATETLPACPAEARFQVNQYASDYVRINCRGDLTLRFEGDASVPLLSSAAHGGQAAFWSNAGESMDSSLTRDFDFTAHSGALTLTYWMWYDLEPDYDYLYLEVSEDGGQHWQILTTPSGTLEDPTGSSFGWAYNGHSGGWVQERVDLSRYAGKKIQVRFEYITDMAVYGEGFLLDDVSIPEAGYMADFEDGDGGWQASGFVRVQNSLPQTFQLALVTRQRQSASVQFIPLVDGRTAEHQFSLGPDVRQAVLVVVAATRYTRQPAGYQILVR